MYGISRLAINLLMNLLFMCKGFFCCENSFLWFEGVLNEFVALMYLLPLLSLKIWLLYGLLLHQQWFFSPVPNSFNVCFADHYLLFDFPGQVELFFLHANAKRVMEKLIKKLNLRVWLLPIQTFFLPNFILIGLRSSSIAFYLMNIFVCSVDCCTFSRCPSLQWSWEIC